LTIKVNRSIFANQYLEDRPLNHNAVIDTCILEGILSFTLTAKGKKFFLPCDASEWNEKHVSDFIKAYYSDEKKEETSLCNLLTYGKDHSARNAVLSAIERYFQQETRCPDANILTPDDSLRLTPMINDHLDACRKRLGVIPRSSVKVLART